MRSTAAADSSVSALAMKASARAETSTLGASSTPKSDRPGRVKLPASEAGTSMRRTARENPAARPVPASTPMSAPGTRRRAAGR